MRHAELHLHMYGTIRWNDYLRHLRGRDVDWSFYESGYERVYGHRPGVRDIVDRHGRGDTNAEREFRELFVFGDRDAGNFDRFQAKFNLLIGGSVFLQLHQYEDPIPPLVEEVLRFARVVLDDQRRDGIGYAEQRFLLNFAPERCRALYGAVLEEYARRDGTDLVPRLAISLPRDDPWPQWQVVQELALERHGEGLTGIDFCHVEEGFPPKGKAELFREVHAFNDRHPERALAILYHVGESFTDKTLESAVRWVQEAAELGAHRLGHAIALGIDPESFGDHERTETAAERRDQLAYDVAHAAGLRRHGVPVDLAAIEQERRALKGTADGGTRMHRYDAARRDEVRRRQNYAMERVRATGAVVEVCPTSNRRIGDIADPAHHPVHRFFEHRLPVVVASDDPGIFDTTIEAELDWVEEHARLHPDDREELAHGAWRYRSEVLTGREKAR